MLAITGFSVCLSFAFSNPNEDTKSTWNLVFSILKGPIEAALGVIYGIFVGILLWYIPERCYSTPKADYQATSKYNLHRFVILLFAGVFALFGSQQFDLGGSGPLAILVLSFVACLRWRPMGYDIFNENGLQMLWTIIQHFLFCLIGADVRIKNMQSEVLVFGIVSLLVGIILRLIAAFLVTYGIGLTFRERLFTSIAWLPKATVQAAIGPVALDNAVTAEDIEKGRLVLTIAVLSILITAPLGAIAIDVCSRFMLTSDAVQDSENNKKELDDKSSADESTMFEVEL